MKTLTKQALSLAVIWSFLCFGAFAQETITGTVSDGQTGETIPGANVLVKGTSNGTSTNSEGAFELNVSSLMDTLVVSFIGYETQETPINNRTSLTIQLTPSVISSEGVVVVGYGTTEKSSLTGSVGTVSGENLNDRDDVNVSEALQGRMPGVSVYSNSGAPGRNSRVRIRGLNSINAGVDPLYVVDGITGVDPSLIDPSNIESVEVLKDASATAIYGARGSNGVILITTKRGRQNQTEVSYNSNVSNRHMYRSVETLNAEEFLEIRERGYKNAEKYDPQGFANGAYEDYNVDPSNFPRLFDDNGNPRYDVNYEEEMYRPTWSTDQSLAVRGGNDNTTYGISLGYTNENGIMRESYYKRYNGKFTIDTQAKSWLNFGGSLTATKDLEHIVDSGYGALNATRTTIETPSIIPVKYPNGEWGGSGDYPGTEGGENPVNIVNNRYTDANAMELRGDVYTNIDITENLRFTSTFSSILRNNKDNFYSSRNLVLLSAEQNGVANVSTNNYFYWQTENYLTWNKQFAENHQIEALIGASWLQNENESLGVTATGFLDDFYQWQNIGASSVISKSGVGGGVSKSSMNSYFSRLQYSYKDKYILTLTGRYDGSSVFGEDNKYAFFPSAGFAWRISEEPFMESASSISNLKLRLSAGSTGNQQIGSYNSLRFLGTQDVLFADGTQTGVTQTSFGNPGLKWETTDQYDVGLELGLFDDRIQLEADYYYKKTRNLLFDRPIPWSTGLNSVVTNIGSLQNQGVELALTTRNISSAEMSWTTNLNWSANRNEILSLGQDNDDIYPGPWFLGQTQILRVGEPIGSFWGYNRLGTWNTDEAAEAAKYGLLPGDLKWEDRNNDGVINNDDNYIMGRAYPLWTGNITNTVNYKNFDASLAIRIVFGSDILNTTHHSAEDRQTLMNSYDTVLDAWTPENQDSDIAQVRAWGTYYSTHVDSHWLEDGSFIRGQNLTIGYSLPQDLLSRGPISNLRIYASAQNLFLITKYSGYDPEATTFGGQLTQNIEFFQYPKPRVIRLGVNLNL